ncbi:MULTISPECIES: 4'-phosphopantetheinyl transferase superfamily protein [unclassified Streptomyces]|uniref:4'-phosphopantetheinyl transferase family protein n=1 Tax=unclassified Streptomyces TaxID=2593676 RepID=UPI002E3379D9|nr:4'-phosphopantetheinyl transferase superfamily protein [Streptomyces sp. NBC_01356]WTB44080.1 4'-phosphopantetheinyl transferase superfamily protein [Streptomyces sp. NBC_00827]WUC17206.1 4'-phosphopantetheinyl transferase superfamily protein [Streptomyces sp. NBC_00564]WUC55523.1 4'-phosphopantetheinyl transferase superfamily protein [Streptomyces sp. NBC_00554]
MSAPHTAARLPVGTGRVHLWVIGSQWAGDHPERMVTSELDDRERERAAAFVRPLDRLTYLMAHIALRRLLTAYTDIPPAQLPLGRDTCPCCGGPHGRPVLHGTPLHFSLSHSHGIALISIAAAPLGVDVQRVPTLQTAHLCLPEMHPAEQQELNALPETERPRAFGRLWTRKEAYFKGLGTGLGRELHCDYLGERTGPDAPARPRGWRVQTVPSCPEHVAALAVAAPADAPPLDITARRLPTECLYTDDATERIAAEQHVCPNWEE